jgi:RNA polymerase sigma-70 factor (ECF subfamily)
MTVNPVRPGRRITCVMEARVAASSGRPAGARVYWPERAGAATERRERAGAQSVHAAGRSGGCTEVLTGKRVDYADQADEELVSLLGRRDVRALEILYSRHARAVYSLSLKMLGEPAAAEEIVQECFLKLWRQPELYQADRGKLLSWLLGVTHHRAVDQLRRRRLEQRHTINEEVQPSADGGTDPEQHLWGRFQMEAVERALADLPPSQRLALELAYLGGMTQVEIAASLGEPLGTIKTRMRLAMQKLRAMPELADLVADAG